MAPRRSLHVRRSAESVAERLTLTAAKALAGSDAWQRHADCSEEYDTELHVHDHAHS
jgi:hypothetical protein